VRATAHIRAEVDADGRTRLCELHSQAPIALRETPDALYIVGSGQGLLDEDVAQFEITVGPGARLAVRSVAASIAYSSTTACLGIRAHVESGGTLEWRPEPLIATAHCHLAVESSISFERDASVDWTEECVLGRAGETPGDLDSAIDVVGPDGPVFRHRLTIGTALAEWDGPVVLGGHRAVGIRVLAGAASIDGGVVADGARWARMPLDAGGEVISAVGRDLLELRAAMGEAAAVESSAVVAITAGEDGTGRDEELAAVDRVRDRSAD
jgi:urease accessory protein